MMNLNRFHLLEVIWSSIKRKAPYEQTKCRNKQMNAETMLNITQSKD